MLKYTDFLNVAGTYLDLLELDKVIQIYQKMMISNIDEKKIYENLKKTKNFYQQKKITILGNNKMENVKEKILSMQDIILKYLLDNKNELDTLYHSKIDNRQLPIYANYSRNCKI